MGKNFSVKRDRVVYRNVVTEIRSFSVNGDSTLLNEFVALSAGGNALFRKEFIDTHSPCRAIFRPSPTHS